MSYHGFRAPDGTPPAIEPRPPARPGPAHRPMTDTRRKTMRRRLSLTALIMAATLWTLAGGPGEAARPEGTLTVAVATFGNERWLPNLYVGAEDVVLKPLWENLLTRDTKGNLIPMLAERWEVLDGGTDLEVPSAQGRPLP